MSRYANPTGQQMLDFLTALGFEKDSPSYFVPTKEQTYSREVKDGLRICVFTTIRHDGRTRRKGSDAIRVTAMRHRPRDAQTGYEWIFIKGSKRVNRTRNWRLNMLKRIEAMEDSL